MKLLDTDIVTLHYRRHAAVVAARAADTPVAVATWCESVRGRVEAVLRADAPDRLVRAQLLLRQAETFLADFPVVDFADPAAALYFAFRADRRFAKTDRGDWMNAAIAPAANAILVTRNVRDYAGIPNLRVGTW